MSSQFDILSGKDISSLTEVGQEDLMQMINQCYPLSNVGFMIVSTVRPDITNNPRFIRYLWLDITDPASPVLKRYIADRTVLVDANNSWETTAVSAASVTTAMLASRSTTGGVTVGHIKTNAGYTDAGNAFYVLRVASNGKDVEAVTLDNALSGGGGVALNRLSTSGLGAGKFLGYNAGVAGYVAIVPSTDLIGSARIALDTNVLPGTAYYVPRTNALGTALEHVTPDNLFVAGTQMLSINKLSTSGAAANDVIRYSGSAWEKVTPSLRIVASDAANVGITVGALGALKVFTQPHGLGVVPKLLRAVIVCTSTAHGFAVGDEIDVFSIRNAAANNVNIGLSADATNVTFTINSAAGNSIANKGTGDFEDLTEANFNLKIYAFR